MCVHVYVYVYVYVCTCVFYACVYVYVHVVLCIHVEIFVLKNSHAIIFRVKIFSYASRPYENILTTNKSTKCTTHTSRER